MTVQELKTAIDDYFFKGCGDEIVIYRDDDTANDIDILDVYFDEDAERLVIRG